MQCTSCTPEKNVKLNGTLQLYRKNSEQFSRQKLFREWSCADFPKVSTQLGLATLTSLREIRSAHSRNN